MTETKQQATSAVDLELEDLEGVGPTTARKMKEAGIGSVVQLAVMSSDELSEAIGGTKEAASNFIMSAKKLLQESKILDNEFTTAEQALEKRKAILRCSTGSANLDTLLLGGLETHAITEFYGEFGSGKSQICHTLSVIASQAPEAGGLGSKVIWLDTEGTFRPERIDQITRARGLDAQAALQNIAICKLYNSSHLELLVKELGKYIEQFGAKLVIVDSIISLHRAEFAGRGTLADRQQKLNGVMHKLTRIAEMYGVAVVITNQVQSTPDTFFGDPTKPAGGNVIGHASTYRVYLRKAGNDRVAKIIDSPYHPYSDTRFTVNEKGIDDTDEKAPKKKVDKDE